MAGPRAYDYVVGAKRHRYAADIICHIKTFHPQGRPLRAGAAAGGGDGPSMCITRRRGGRRRCSTMRRGPRGRSSIAASDGGGDMSEDKFEAVAEASWRGIPGRPHGTRGRRCLAGRGAGLEADAAFRLRTWSSSKTKERQSGTLDVGLREGCADAAGLSGGRDTMLTMPRRTGFYRLTVVPWRRRGAGADAPASLSGV